MNQQLSYLEPSRKEFILYFQEISFSYIHLKGFIDDGKSNIILNILPPTVAMSYNATKEPVIMPKKTYNNNNNTLNKVIFVRHMLNKYFCKQRLFISVDHNRLTGHVQERGSEAKRTCNEQ